jgi:hypothetical protein
MNENEMFKSLSYVCGTLRGVLSKYIDFISSRDKEEIKKIDKMIEELLYINKETVK